MFQDACLLFSHSCIKKHKRTYKNQTHHMHMQYAMKNHGWMESWSVRRMDRKVTYVGMLSTAYKKQEKNMLRK